MQELTQGLKMGPNGQTAMVVLKSLLLLLRLDGLKQEHTCLSPSPLVPFRTVRVSVQVVVRASS